MLLGQTIILTETMIRKFFLRIDFAREERFYILF